jgi:hypothetical protein
VQRKVLYCLYRFQDPLWSSRISTTLEGRKRTTHFGDIKQLDNNKETCIGMCVLKDNERLEEFEGG